MHIESENYDFLMYTLNAGQPVPSSTTVLRDKGMNIFSRSLILLYRTELSAPQCFCHLQWYVYISREPRVCI